MRFIKRIWWKHQLNKYKLILVQAGLQEALKGGKNIQVGSEEKCVNPGNSDPLESIYLPSADEGEVDATKLIDLGAEKLPDAAKRFLDYRHRLEGLEE